ncbi:hypothetical protein V8F20_005137 [Naviculisporaceae sp. PSN 640]
MMNPLTRILAAVIGVGMIEHASGWAITPPPACPTVTETTTACPSTCTWPLCAILSTLTAHCGCPDPALTVSATFKCTPGKCLPFPPPCPTLYTVTRISDCTGPTHSSKPPPISSTPSSPIPSSTLPPSSSPCSTITSSEPPISSSTEPITSSSTITSKSLPPESSSTKSFPPPPESESTSASPTAPPVETSTSLEPETISSTAEPSPTVPAPPPSSSAVQSHGERRLKRPFWMLGLLF